MDYEKMNRQTIDEFRANEGAVGGWWWCRNEAGDEGWVPRSALEGPTS